MRAPKHTRAMVRKRKMPIQERRSIVPRRRHLPTRIWRQVRVKDLPWRRWNAEGIRFVRGWQRGQDTIEIDWDPEYKRYVVTYSVRGKLRLQDISDDLKGAKEAAQTMQTAKGRYIPKKQWIRGYTSGKCKLCGCPEYLSDEKVCPDCYMKAVEREYWKIRRGKK